MTPRAMIVPYLRGNAWWARVPKLDGESVRRPLGIFGKENKDVAVEACQFLMWLRNRRHSFLLDALHAKRTTPGQAFTAYAENRLDGFVGELRDGVNDVDLEPYVAKWQRELERRSKPIASERGKYLRHVRTLIPDGQVFRRSRFSPQRVADWLDDIKGQTNRWRASLSSFAEYLVFAQVIATNPVRAVRQTRENDPRTTHLVQLDAKKLVQRFERDKLRAFHAAMLATGMEHGAAKALDPGTITDNTAFARGTKGHRQRTVRIYERWEWAWIYVRAFMHKHSDGTQPFHDVTYDASRWALRKALSAANLTEDYTQHDHRHTWAVQAVRDGMNDYVIADQLGNSVAMVRKVYGRFRPTAADFTRSSTVGNTTKPSAVEPQDAK